MGIEAFDRVPLLFGPSPIHRLDRLAEHLGATRRSGPNGKTGYADAFQGYG